MARALVAVYEGMVLDEGEAEGGRLVGDRWIEVRAAEGHTWLGESGFQGIQVENAGRAS